MNSPHQKKLQLADYERLAEIMEKLEQLNEETRNRFVKIFCEQNPDLKDKLERLINHQNNLTGFLSKSPGNGIRGLLNLDSEPTQPALQEVKSSLELSGEYQIIEKVKTGGMAEIYRALNISGNGPSTECAIKRILPHFSNDKNLQTMFQNEINICLQLKHPNIVETKSSFVTKDGCFLVMEFIAGCTLNELNRTLKRKNLLLPEEYSCYLISEVCKALEYAHHQKDLNGLPMELIHRDISMENIMLTEGGLVKVLDFGIAKIKDSQVRTGTGIMKGKLHYMSPEQASGGKIDSRSDLYSLGLVFYELLTGELALEGKNDLAVIQNASSGTLRPITASDAFITADVKEILYKCLSTSVATRYQTADEVRAAILSVFNKRKISVGANQISDFLKSPR